jgi:septal ring factor EnvC (AmiA/AmiB activator)
MGLISFQEFMAARESSAATRSKTAAALGLGPDVADVFGHATPPPWQAEKLLKKLKKKNKKKDSDIKDDVKESATPDYSFDKLVKKAASAAQEIDKELTQGEKDAEEIEKKIKNKKEKKKNIAQRPTPPIPRDAKPPEDEDPSHDVDQPEEPVDKKGSNKGEADSLTEEAYWHRLLGNTSFDQH